MNAFPDDFVNHNLPLVVLSGLGEEQDDNSHGDKARNLLSEGGFRIKTNAAPVTGPTAERLLQTLLTHDSSQRSWRALAEQNAAFRIHIAGRKFTLPPRKAPPPAQSPRLRPAIDGRSPPPQLVLHSPISPLTPSSPIYPDGIMTPLWITKHQSRLPSIFISFFTLFSDSNSSTLQDNIIKSEANNIRSVLASTNYKTKLVIVLLGDGQISESDAEERSGNIRKAAGLDGKSLFYLAAESSPSEVSHFASNLLKSLHPGCVEYYRDLSKHARRKRNRNVVPQPTVQPSLGTSQTLSLAAWNVRYEFKLGVFAEFRQEMEAALRNYETAYESLFSPEVFEATPSWSSRFNEARMLSDVIAIRIIRCVLWLGQTTTAVRWWSSHRNRVQNLIDRKSAGSETYGWEAWQSMWSKVMAEMIQRAEILSNLEAGGSETFPLFIDGEKMLPTGQRSSPWESLHHQGYWLNLAQRYTQNRRARALQIPEEDRASPGQSPASKIASRAHLYDRYLVLEPYLEFPLDGRKGYDYARDIVQTLDAAIQYFNEHKQARMVEVLQLKKASELMREQSWEDAISILRSIWNEKSWKEAGWWGLLDEVGKSLLICAMEVNHAELITQLQWQLSHPIFKRGSLEEQQLQSDQARGRTEFKAQTALDNNSALVRFISAFTFATAEGHVGEAMDAQISIKHIALDTGSTARLRQVKIVFEGGLRPIYLIDERDQSEHDTEHGLVINNIQLEDAQARAAKTRRSSIGAASAESADVSLMLNPGQVKIFQLQVIPREAGDVSVASITMTFDKGEREMTITTSHPHDDLGQWWEIRGGRPVSRPCGRERDTTCATILPKPPKIDVLVPELRRVFYTNEAIQLTIQCENHEDQAVSGSIEVRLLSPGKNGSVLRCGNDEASNAGSPADAVTFVQQLPPKKFVSLGVGQRTEQLVTITNVDEPIDHELEILVSYSLLSSPDTNLSKTSVIDIPVIRPFEANFSFHSRHHDEEWPSFFSTHGLLSGAKQASGIKQQFLITALICSFAVEDVHVESTQLTTQKIVGGAMCTITPGTLRQTGGAQKTEEDREILIHPEENKRFGFDMTIQKLVLGSREPVAVDVLLEVRWKRKGSNESTTSVLPVPRFLAPSAEPRVLLRARKDESVSGMYRLCYTMENPSLHFLSFNLTMESSDDFAFSGMKSRSLSLVPVSRHSVVFRILPSKSKAWVRVHLEVVDAYFGQTLRIQPAAEGVRVDKQGDVLVWVD